MWICSLLKESGLELIIDDAHPLFYFDEDAGQQSAGDPIMMLIETSATTSTFSSKTMKHFLAGESFGI